MKQSLLFLMVIILGLHLHTAHSSSRNGDFIPPVLTLLAAAGLVVGDYASKNSMRRLLDTAIRSNKETTTRVLLSIGIRPQASLYTFHNAVQTGNTQLVELSAQYGMHDGLINGQTALHKTIRHTDYNPLMFFTLLTLYKHNNLGMDQDCRHFYEWAHSKFYEKAKRDIKKYSRHESITPPPLLNFGAYQSVIEHCSAFTFTWLSMVQ